MEIQTQSVRKRSAMGREAKIGVMKPSNATDRQHHQKLGTGKEGFFLNYQRSMALLTT